MNYQGLIISLIIVILLFSFGVLFYVIWQKRADKKVEQLWKKNQSKAEEIEYEKDQLFKQSYQDYIDELILTLKKRGYDDLILSDFQITKDVISSINGRGELLSFLNGIKVDICQRLRLVASIPLELIDISTSDNETNSGQFSWQGYRGVITVKYRPSYSIETTLSILCHELTHYFISFHRLIDPQKNKALLSIDPMEIKTDILANLIGFNQIMAKGYQTTYYDDRKTKVGYLTSDDCVRIGKIISEYRADSKLKEELKQAKKQVELSLNESRELLNCLKTIDPRHYRSSQIKTPEQVKQVNEALLEYDSNNVNRQLEDIEKRLASNDIRTIHQLEFELHVLHGKMIRWSNSFQGIE